MAAAEFWYQAVIAIWGENAFRVSSGKLQLRDKKKRVLSGKLSRWNPGLRCRLAVLA